jgi:thymidine phosphorylase
MRDDCAVCRAEGFEAQSQVKLTLGERMILATLNVVHGDWLAADEAGLSESAWRMLAPGEGDLLEVAHPRPLESFAHVRAKLYGHRLTADQLEAVMADVVRGRYADVHLAAFVAACAARPVYRVVAVLLTHFQRTC